MIGYLNDFRVMTICSLIVIPLLLASEKLPVVPTMKRSAMSFTFLRCRVVSDTCA